MLHLQLRGLDGEVRQVEVAAEIRQRKRVTDLTWGENGGSDIFDIIREGEGDEHRMRLRYMELETS